MNTIEIKDSNHQSLLSAVNTEVEQLCYRTKEPLDSWEVLATAFPNLIGIEFISLGEVAGKVEIGAAFFRLFPNLQKLIVRNWGAEPIKVNFEGADPLSSLRYARFTDIRAEQVAWLGHCRELENLVLSFTGQLTDFPSLPKLTHLTLQDGDMVQLPVGIRENDHIARLHLEHINAMQRFGDMSHMQSLESLLVTPCKHKHAQLPSQGDLLTLPAVTSISLWVIPEHFEPVWLQLARTVDFLVLGTTFNKEWQLLEQLGLSDEELVSYLSVLAKVNKPEQLPEMPAKFHLLLMEAKYNRFKAQHKAWLSAVAAQNQQTRPFGAGSTLFVCGRSGFKATELKAKAAEIGFAISKKLDDSVTHLLLGRAPKEVALIDFERHAIIDDSVLQRCFAAEAPKFLQQQGGEVMESSILEMLASPDEASHKVAAEMLLQGGVTEAMRLPLFFVLKTTADNKFRKQLKQLLTGMGDEAFQLAVNDRALFHDCRGMGRYNQFKGQTVMVDKLNRLRKKWGPALCMEFAQLYYQRYGEGFVYVLTQEEPSELRLKMLEFLVEGDCLNWRRGMCFDQVEQFWQDTPVRLHRFRESHLDRKGSLNTQRAPLPAEFVEQYGIRRLDLGNCLLYALPLGIEHFLQVTHLDLSRNIFDDLPEWFNEFTQLQELNLSSNSFEAFPDVLLNMPWLKKLDFRRASRPPHDGDYDTNYESIAVPQAFFDANPDCEVLQD